MSERSKRERIVDAALSLAETKGWEEVRLHDVADSLSISLEDIRQEFSEKDQLVDAWFDRADSAMLQDAAEWKALEPSCRQRMHRVMMTWLSALSGHRRVTRQMILGKLEPGHIHIQIPGLMRISRTVQWMREAAGYDAGFPRRALEETIHTSVYLATFSYWMFDDSLNAERTSRFLQRQLSRAGFLLSCDADRSRGHGDARTANKEPSTNDYDPVT
ncbi:MAG: TetR/AcrR family transcriptional regulator [Gammaproteobacteria bacterium]|nr:TetR/AcrR family transcriptional regulator [Gammaproteobacteria bacterium]